MRKTRCISCGEPTVFINRIRKKIICLNCGQEYDFKTKERIGEIKNQISFKQSDLMDCSTKDFIHLIYSYKEEYAATTLAGILGVLRALYAQTEEALKDLKKKINDKDFYTIEEKELFINLNALMWKAEERCRLVVERLKDISPDVLEALETGNLTNDSKSDTIKAQQ